MSEKAPEFTFGNAAFLSVGHFVTDLYPAFLPPLLPLLVDKFQLTFTRASLLAAVLSLSASLTQPIFGYLSDRLGGRKMILWGPVVAALSLSFIGLAHQYSLLTLLLIVGGLGVASFHPEAAALAASLSQRKRTLGMSIFMLGGNAGYGLGPLLILLVVTGLGLEWSFLASLPALGLPWLLKKHAPLLPQSSGLSASAPIRSEPYLNRRILSFGRLFGIVVLRVTAISSLIAFLPMVQKLRGFSLFAAGSSFTIFMLCGALGGLSGGFLADRLGRKKVILASFIAIIPVFLSFLFWKGPAAFFTLGLLGFFFFLSEPACIVLAQEMAPKKARTVSGLIMGMAWGLAAFGVLATGALADSLGIEWALRFLLLLPAGSLILSLFLPGK